MFKNIKAMGENICPPAIEKLRAYANRSDTYFYGSTNQIMYRLEFIRKYAIPIKGIILKNGYKKNDSFNGIPVFEESYLKDFNNKNIKINLLVALYHDRYDEVELLGKNSGIEYIVNFEGAQWQWAIDEKRIPAELSNKLILVDCTFTTTQKRQITYKFLQDNLQDFQKTFEWLDDELSQEAMFNYVIGHVYLKELAMKDVRCDNQYFPKDIIKLKDEEIFVDCGAFDGDSIKMFLKNANDKYRCIYAFEPDGVAYDKLRMATSKYSKKIYCHNVGVGAKSGCASMTICHGESKINSSGNYDVNIVALDDVINENITMLKMDIEGMELSALQGAKNLIKKYRPKLAICVYHKPEDLIEIPQIIKSFIPDYKIYLRGHYSNLSELVLYAV